MSNTYITWLERERERGGRGERQGKRETERGEGAEEMDERVGEENRERE